MFEAVNETLQELFVGTTSFPDELGSLPHSVTFRAITHWEPGQQINCRVIEPELALEDALKFARKYAEAAGRTGWKVLTE